MKFSYVIPAHNGYTLVNQLLLDLLQKVDPKDEVILMDDASTEDKYLNGLKWWKSQIPQLSVYRTKENKGFLLTANEGIKKATGDVVVLVSTDVRIFKNISEQITEFLKVQPKSLIGGTVYRHSTGWNDMNGRVYHYAEGYLLATTRDGWKELGYFDEQYAPFDFEDVDLSTTAISLGYTLAQLPMGSVQHIGGQTISYGYEREIQTRKNQDKFRKKWKNV